LYKRLEVEMLQAKQQENREKGETRTLSILSDGFWVLKRSVDIDGADFLVQIPAGSLEELRNRQKRIEVFGVIQAKYFENSNQVKIQKIYIEDAVGPRPEFFALLHTNDSASENVHYFFTAQQIIQEFYIDKNDEYYCFGLTQNRNYKRFRNIPTRKILGIIKRGILSTEEERNRNFIKVVYVTNPYSVQDTRKKVYETPDAIHELHQRGNLIEITKTDKATGTQISIGQQLGNLEQIEYDPVTGTTRAKFNELE
jgi:hypothetical protein